MEPSKQFQNKSKAFWANVRTISQHVGYSESGSIIIPTLGQIAETYAALGLNSSKVLRRGVSTKLGDELIAYFALRARKLNDYVQPRLMDAAAAKRLFDEQKELLQPKCPLPMNKQKGEKRTESYLTGLVNMIVEANTAGFPCDYDPRELTTVTRNGVPLRTLARRVDGAFPQIVNPIAVWEIKEYYYTTTFGSRVADGVYESLLDGLELEELRKSEGIDIKHYLMIDAHYTWWVCGKPYLCRIFDMLHMGYVDEVFIGKEVVERLPAVARSWKRIAKRT